MRRSDRREEGQRSGCGTRRGSGGFLLNCCFWVAEGFEETRGAGGVVSAADVLPE